MTSDLKDLRLYWLGDVAGAALDLDEARAWVVLALQTRLGTLESFDDRIVVVPQTQTLVADVDAASHETIESTLQLWKDYRAMANRL